MHLLKLKAYKVYFILKSSNNNSGYVTQKKPDFYVQDALLGSDLSTDILIQLHDRYIDASLLVCYVSEQFRVAS